MGRANAAIVYLSLAPVACASGPAVSPAAVSPAALPPTAFTSLRLLAPPCAPLSVAGDAEDEVAESLLRCPGVAGYQLLILDADARVTVTIVTPHGEQLPLEYGRAITPHFSRLGSSALWWQEGASLAVAVPVLANEDPEAPEEVTAYWAVAKITSSEACVTTRLELDQPEATSDEHVRSALAAAPGLPCLLAASASNALR